MLRRTLLISLVVALAAALGGPSARAQSIAPAYDYDDYDRAQIDRYLAVEVWTGNSDGEYYEGDDIVVYFRANRDAFVAIYSIDTRGRVNLLFPTYPEEDNFIRGGVTYRLPGDDHNYDLEVTGPEGFEHIQIIASRERFDIPNWYRGPELVADTDDRDSYMDWVNANYFVRYGGQRFAYDRAVIYVNEWEEYYFRPIYHPVYPSWTIYGNCYIDYPWGASVYVNGIYWGCAPLYIPHIAVGWHVITVYDRYGYCWEHDFHVSHYNTIVFNKTIINTSPTVKSKYKEVRMAGYVNPVTHGYPDFESRKVTMTEALKRSRSVATKSGGPASAFDVDAAYESVAKKHVRGSTKMVKTERGYETDASTAIFPDRADTKRGSTSRTSERQNAGDQIRPTKRSVTTDSNRPRRSISEDRSTRRTSGGSIDRSRTKARPSSTSRATPQIQKKKSSGKSGSGSVQRKKSDHRKPSQSTSSGTKKETKVKSSGSKSKSSDGGKSSSSSSGKSSTSGGKSKKSGGKK